MNLSLHTTDEVDCGDLLAAFAVLCEQAPCVFRRRGDEELLAVGVAASTDVAEAGSFAAAHRDMREQFGDLDDEDLAQLRMIGWSAFDPAFSGASNDAATPSWDAFSRRRLYVPRLVVERRAGRTTCTLVRPPGDRTNTGNHCDVGTPWDRTSTDDVGAPGDRTSTGNYYDVGAPGDRTSAGNVGAPGDHTNTWNYWKSLLEDPPERPQGTVDQVETTWLDEDRFEDGVRQVVAHQEASKVVLARRARLEADAPIPPAGVLEALSSEYPSCSIFAISPQADSAYPTFVGATPERLARVADGRVETMALAGTTRKDGAEAERALQRSAKDLGEHRFVVEMIVEALAPHCTELEAGGMPRLHRLANVSHLMTPISGTLAKNVGLAEVVDALHPTPAVCGTPREIARDLICELEGYDRGLYAGTFGWMNAAGDGEFDVALRCGLVDESSALAFAGAGITDKSDAAEELVETRRKFEPMVDAIEAVRR